ncbi:ubiquitin activating enzyme [Pisolithus microcarpus]|nr:ubiquitin activating enzyme [Pisolithus microcarpus]
MADTANLAAKMDIDEAEIDEGLYSRQLYVLGHEAMKKMAASNVLIVGLNGLGAEIAKNVCLAGVKSVTLYDPEPVTLQDLSSQYLLREGDIGKPRAAATLPRLSELNAYVPVRNLGGRSGQEISVEMIRPFQVILCSASYEKQLEINDWTHANGVHFISAEVRGLFGSVFNDFGPKFTCVDTTGEQALTGMIVSVDKDKEGLVTCLDETRHGLEDVQGMEELNGCKPRKVSCGIFHQVRMPKIIEFFFITDFAKFDRPATLHAGFQALSQFRKQNQRLPRARNPEDAAVLVSLAKNIDTGADEKVLTELAYQATGDLSPIVAVIGGFVAQEALKACSAKFHPMVQHMYFDSLESLPSMLPTEDDCKPIGKKIAGHRQFLVGAGAIGCEMLKNWSMMGLATGPDGKIHVTDLDTIEKSNLNRQFLFRPKDLGKFKSEVAAAAVSEMNPALEGHILCKQEPVGQSTENVFDDDFFGTLDGCYQCFGQRQYMDQRCILYQKPLLESGTMGTKGNVQVDPPEKQTLSCTVKNFPNAITHTIEWARQEFDAMFVKPIESVNQYLSEPNYLENSLKYSGQQRELVEQIVSYLVSNRPLTFEECILWARLQFEEKFNNAIRQLLHSLPKDHLTSTGQPFWSGPKRAPDPLAFDSSDPAHLAFIIAAANLHAYNYGLRGETDPNAFKKVADSIIVPEFTPKSGVTIQINENDTVERATSDSDDLNDLVKKLPPPSSLAGFRLTPAASNLRALNYKIPVADRHTTKQIAGKIIPAIATTTALVVGLVCLELYKIIDGNRKLEEYKNGFVNLALPFLRFGNTEWTLWDRIEFNNDPTLKEFIQWFRSTHSLDVTMVSQGSAERLPMKFSKLVEHVSKRPIPPHTKHLLVEVMLMDEEGEDVEVPFILVRI